MESSTTAPPPPAIIEPQTASVTNQQPVAQPAMNAGPGGSRNAKNIPYNASGEREWSFGLFECFEDPMTCLFAWFLPCTIYGKNKTRLQALASGAPHPQGGELVGEDTITYAALNCCCGLGWVVGMTNRAETRARYKIVGGAGDDCFLSCCCAPCALTQQSREIELEEQSLGHPGGGMSGFANNVNNAAKPTA
ncbi:PLAC8-domain-containing protein [Exidia glandulosa HHB12029]|uniref:PLAC8-domain-containing protein n=1 Tax=Exidia glandulosa HHB12029 TaxID=1314781 RepID=A0A165I7U9_EXIGL|nr:PLAC8-domain-containing protein [Exidia glandulosa HHB12029]